MERYQLTKLESLRVDEPSLLQNCRISAIGTCGYLVRTSYRNSLVGTRVAIAWKEWVSQTTVGPSFQIQIMQCGDRYIRKNKHSVGRRLGCWVCLFHDVIYHVNLGKFHNLSLFICKMEFIVLPDKVTVRIKGYGRKHTHIIHICICIHTYICIWAF